MRKLVLDFDSTLAALMEPWMIWLYRKGYSDYVHDLSEVESYCWMHEKYGNSVSGFFHDDPEHTYSNYVLPYPGAKEFVRWTLEHFEEVEIVTHSNKPETEKAKVEWAREYLDFDNLRFFSVLEDKFKHIQGSILLDDYPLHVIKHLSRNGCPGIVFDYNKGNGWSKLETYKDLLNEENVNICDIKYEYNYYGVMKSLMNIKGI